MILTAPILLATVNEQDNIQNCHGVAQEKHLLVDFISTSLEIYLL